MSTSRPDNHLPSDFPGPDSVVLDNQGTILVVIDGPADRTSGPARFPVMREWPRPQLPKLPEPPKPETGTA